MNQAKSLTTSLALVVTAAGCANDRAADDLGSRLKREQTIESCMDCLDAPRILESGVSLSCKTDKIQGFEATLMHRSNSTILRIERDASFHGFSVARGMVLIVDRYYSNEDKVILVNLNVVPAQRVVLRHTEWDDYIHSHYDVLSADKDGIRVQEYQYAGKRPPRARIITLSLKAPLGPASEGPWTRPKDYPRTNELDQ